MDARFSVVVVPHISLISIKLGGFFRIEDVVDFADELTIKMRALRCRPNDHVTLCDVTAMKIQPQEVVAQFAAVVGHPNFKSRRLAFATGSSLARLQTQRLTNRDGVAYFLSADEAQAWLLQSDAVDEPVHGKPESPPAEMAAAEMARRKISL